MSAIDKLKDTTPSDQAGIETDGTGAPDSGHVEKISSSEATEVAAEGVEEATGAVDSSQEEILKEQEPAVDAKAEPSAEHTPLTLHPKVEEAGVQIAKSAENLNSAVAPLEMLSGAEVPAASVKGSRVELASTKKGLEEQVIDERGKAAKGASDNGKKWGGLAHLIAEMRQRFQQLPQSFPENVIPINQAPSFGKEKQEALPQVKAA